MNDRALDGAENSQKFQKSSGLTFWTFSLSAPVQVGIHQAEHRPQPCGAQPDEGVEKIKT